MKRYSKEELDDLLKEKSDQYLLYPSDRVWSNIQKELHPKTRWRYVSLSILFFFIASVSIHVKKNELAKSRYIDQQNLYEYISTPSLNLLNNSLELPEIFIPVQPLNKSFVSSSTKKLADQLSPSIRLERNHQIDLPKSIAVKLTSFPNTSATSINNNSQKEKHSISETLEKVVTTAKKVGKDIRWQVYGGPSIAYRRLEGQATRNIYQYAVYSLSTNAAFARDVKDVVNHRPAMGFELGTAMVYPLSKRFNIRTGVQANYSQYQIKAFSAIPEIATYSVNNSNSSSGSLSAVSMYRNNSGLSPATIQNEHYMISLPVGLDYRVSGTDKLNFTVGSSIQPTYVFANYSYLLSSNLQNYAKEPSLNRNWNINGAVEASINFERKGYRWSIAPQFRYQLLSSFKDKYPIKENLMDMGIKVGIIKTIN